MAPASSIQFIEAALSCTGPLALSYSTASQKWLIREHLLLLLQDFPSFFPSTDTFTHNDGITVNLLNASGFLPVSSYTPIVSLTIWLQQKYPYEPPLVFLSPTNPIPHNHPFVDPSGAITSPYLKTWTYPHSNLLDLARNLVHIFTHHHPFFSPFASTFSTPIDPTFASKREVLDRLMGVIHYDMVALQTKAEEDIEGLSCLQAGLLNRAAILTATLHEIKQERSSLKQRVMELTEEADVLTNWLRVQNTRSIVSNTIEDAFEATDEESGCVLDCWAADDAIEDVMHAMGKAMAEGAVPLRDYLKQVRTLSKEQFFHRDKLEKLRSSDTLNEPY